MAKISELIYGIVHRSFWNFNITKPETYWVLRRGNVVGRASLGQLGQGRQADTYRAVFDAIQDRGVMHVVDLGCNISALGQLLFDWGYAGKYTGFDNNLYALKEGRRALQALGRNYELGQANIRALPFAGNSFECVVMKDVLEHMEDFKPLLGEALRVSSRYAIIANFIPWTEGDSIIRRQPGGFYLNMYSRSEVYGFARARGWQVSQVISALEKDSRPNEVVIFTSHGKPSVEQTSPRNF